MREGLLSLDPEYSTLKLTVRGRDALRRRAQVMLPDRPSVKKVTVSDAAQPHRDLFDQLRALRKQVADSQGVPAFVILHDKTLRLMAASLPDDRSQLRRIPGIGDRKIAEYGDLFLNAIREYARDSGAKPVPVSEPIPVAVPKSSGTTSETPTLLRDGMSVAAIAQVRGLAESTIQGHLANAIESGVDVDLDALVPPEKQVAIRKALEASDEYFLRPVLDALGPGFTYGEVRLVRAAMSRVELEASA